MGGICGKRRVWRTPEESHHPHVIKRRWKGFKEFMFWGCFSYDKQGPCFIWEDETAAEKEAAKKDLKARNDTRYESDKLAWELETGMRRVGLRNKPGIKPQFKHTEETGAYIRKKGRGGIDWYRYQKYILEDLLLLFAEECRLDRPNIVV